MGILYIVGTPIGNLNDITFRALEVLKSVDYIACEDTRQSLKLLNHFDMKKKLVAYHKFNENEKSKSIIDDLLSGLSVAVVTDAGTPCISDPGYVLVKKAHKNNIQVIAIPGASAVVSALSVSGIDTSQFSFIGFLPVDNKKFNDEISKMIESKIRTFVIYESPKRIIKLFSKLIEVFPHSLVYVASDLTKIHERGFYGSIEDVYSTLSSDQNVEKGEYAIVLNKCIVEEKNNDEEELSIEAELVDIMVKEKIGLKDAIGILNSQRDKCSKKEIYNASLTLKEMFQKN